MINLTSPLLVPQQEFMDLSQLDRKEILMKYPLYETEPTEHRQSEPSEESHSTFQLLRNRLIHGLRFEI